MVVGASINVWNGNKTDPWIMIQIDSVFVLFISRSLAIFDGLIPLNIWYCVIEVTQNRI